MPFNPNEPRDDHGRWTDGGFQHAANTLYRNHPTAREAEHAKKKTGEITITKKDKRLTIDRGDGRLEIRNGGSHAWRNNNLGNLGPGAFANRHGALGGDGPTNKESSRAVFPDVATGQAAMDALLKNTYKEHTIRTMIEKYADKEKHSHEVQRYKDFIHKNSGLSLDTKISSMTSDQFKTLVDTMKKQDLPIQIRQVRVSD